ncbi:protein MEI2-like 7 [Gossypium raimondii]|uniref:protein MEI2-like 7 n=1 Tax=Gossypium raimondii TaxID=29730 RepID=UPI002279F471|nr:protein MEI2-like 7 [Gossypium raimondii]
MAIVRADVAQDFPHNIGMRNWSLNPEAPEFFPARKRLLSASSPVFSPSTPIFLRYYTHPLLSASTFSHLSYTYPHPHALQPHFFIPEKAASASVPMTETVTPLLEPFKTTMVVDEAPEPRTAARKENLGGTRPSVRDKPYWKSDKRYGKKGFVIVDRNSSQARKKQCRGKPSSYSSQDKKHFAKTYPKTARGRAGNKYNKREKHPPIPLKPDGLETTVMIKNIPNRYTTKSNKGYAFVNFTNPKAARKFSRAWHNKHWPCINSNKIREIHCAKLQGREELVKHFENMEFPSENFQPLSFNPARDGSKQAVKETIVGRCIGSK